MKIYYLGPEGSYTEKAALKFAELTNLKITPAESIYSVFREVERGNYGVVPTENSIEGSVTLTLDLLLRFPVKIFGETSLEIKHALLGYDLSKIRVVLSHPQALAQCREFIQRMRWGVRETNSTAEAVKIVAESNDPTLAAIGSREAAEIYGLKVLAEDIQDYPNNKTRFILIGREDMENPLGDKTPQKGAIFLELENVPGALYRALGVFAKRGVNLTRIESRPSLKDLGYYIFYIDYEYTQEEDEILEELKQVSKFLKHLGKYYVV
ncbi:prephenate dehydratase [Pyrococcus furiosus DSM 3638]|uniref:prephenate dehydratase n=3 Tax=Pyrococcus furiosus TaxID=2261 RepID=Q8U408_PYRFU|nr:MULTISPECIES: prephenate dehydratase [Pyrococcus]AAL80415.1 prephenate dehydratase [Pyrococcus furiosus DSM 3638]AFN03078.1 prephenate dehydratase [Pyrococcus furiosus COM1]MDK2870134.1 prephenate dehydratase [Pyrococcus sp.]QEK78008.1 prephenate dehydratase [Pyrococcus furiosus DSM 3638]